ncbi:MAG: hypothetical protein COV07_00920 [Candidatus Vogelbacteria bacterium CG10_big_fil_rev_8_21_14_0_10_45_14]|uniref:Uncharacterized protein n=1 Tax=Candidatus Vogelbacteria bacterium CG10_big_fil_rev_8_21_14_0_10_45_14 TaxID=1975042 RepID=A0A2H0RKP0_9BACT|nr:MAG: hypothetical protein COV07_00920 [Candidatus Vogelbacteria bacterium CG10_big_fil_rev_8_21_14_0_10_45_14]
MEIHHGGYRTAIIVGSLVFKFPRVKGWPMVVKRMFQYARANTAKDTLRFCHEVILLRLEWFWSAIVQNWTEHRCWKMTRANYLAPVYFSVGLLNLCVAVRGDVPSLEEWFSVLQKLPEDATRYLSCTDPHDTFTHNVRRTASEYVFVDYGDKINHGEAPITEFFIKWKLVLEEILRIDSRKHDNTF